MKKTSNLSIIFGLILIAVGPFAKATISDEVQEVVVKEVKSVGVKTESKIGSYFGEKKALSSVFKGNYQDIIDLRQQRRLGLGLKAAGALGSWGVVAELNYGQQDSALLGYGGASKYNALSFSWKHVFGGGAVSAFSTMGYSRWYTFGSNAVDSSSFRAGVLNRLLSEEEKKTGKFAKDLITPSLGVQYSLLSGPYVGVSLSAEVVILTMLSSLDLTPTGSLGFQYYF